MIGKGLDGLDGARPAICVVGAGPVGLSLALELERAGHDVLLLESGDQGPTASAQALSDADIDDPTRHVPMNIGVQRSLGGTSNLWGGRCVPFAPIDFEQRAAVPHSGWPISQADIAPFLPAACAHIGCGTADFEQALPGFAPSDTDFTFDKLERWSRRPRFTDMYSQHLRQSSAIDLRLCATVTGLDFAADGRVARIEVRSGEQRAWVAPGRLVVATGGLETTRLLLASRRDAPNRFGGEDGPLGRFYMGHLYGIVAEMELRNPAVETQIEYFRDPAGFYMRRRFTPSEDLQRRMGLTNGSLWPDYPQIRDPAHRNGILSLAYLALSIPPLGRRIVAESIRQHYVGDHIRRWPHIVNILRDAPRTAAFLPGFLYRRYLADHRMPGFFQRNAARRYAIRFHAEHLPDPASRITLSGQQDAYGLPRAAVDFRYRRANADLLIRMHDCFDAWLARTGAGTMHWLVPAEERADFILAQCYDGHHQIGTARMGLDERKGVVNRDCRVFGSANLFLAGSAVFPTSGEANPTLTAVALAMRLARRLAAETGHAAP